MEKNKFKMKMPHAYVLILALVILAGILTYIIPAGVYDFVDVGGKQVVDPESFHYVEQTPVSFWDMLLAVPQGMIKQAGLIFMIFIISGSMEIVSRTGALEASVGRLAKKFRNKLYIVIPLLLTCFAFLGATNVNNSIVAFIPLGLLIAFSLGADALVGVAIVGTGMNLGFTGGAFSAANVGTAQIVCGLPLFSGYGLRIALSAVLVVAGSIYLIRYTKRVQNDPTASVVYGVEGVVVDNQQDLPEFTGRRKLVLLAFLIGLGFVIYGAIKIWNANDAIPCVFLCTGVVCGALYGMKANDIANAFIDGAKKITYGALIIGFSTAIGTVMTNGKIIYTVVHALGNSMAGLPKVFAALMMYIVNIIINTFITSGSGQAAAVMPIMSPLATVVGLTQQTAVLAFQLGDGFTNQILPMSSVLMAGLAFGGIPFGKWLKFFWKWLLINLLIGAAFLVFAVVTGYGPF